jgi:hypothetical protein
LPEVQGELGSKESIFPKDSSYEESK